MRLIRTDDGLVGWFNPDTGTTTWHRDTESLKRQGIKHWGFTGQADQDRLRREVDSALHELMSSRDSWAEFGFWGVYMYTSKDWEDMN